MSVKVIGPEGCAEVLDPAAGVAGSTDEEASGSVVAGLDVGAELAAGCAEGSTAGAGFCLHAGANKIEASNRDNKV
jgi:hypothetical protein